MNTREQEFEPLMGYPEVCALFNRNYKTIWKWVRVGKFPEPIKLSGRTIGWKREDIRAVQQGEWS